MTVTLSLWHLLVGTIGGAGTLGAVIAAGLWLRFIKPLVRAEIVSYEGEANTVAARDAATRRVCEDQVLREDGVIRRKLDGHATSHGADLSELQSTLSEISQRLARMEGALAAAGLTPSEPPFDPTPHRGVPPVRPATLPGARRDARKDP